MIENTIKINPRYLHVNDLNLSLAAQLIHINHVNNKVKIHPLTLVLGKIIEKSSFGVIEDPISAASEISKELKISLPVYRKFFNRLIKMRIIARNKGTVIVSPVASTPLSFIKIISTQEYINLKNKNNGN